MTDKQPETEKKKRNANHPCKWKPGQSGNPKGRPRKAIVTDACKKVLETPFPAHLIPANHPLEKELQTLVAEGATYAEVMAFTQTLAAIRGETQAFNALANRVEGMPRQKVELDATIKPDYDYSGIPDEQLENIINLQNSAKNLNDGNDDSDTTTRTG